MAWTIVRHSFFLLFRNFSEALKVSIGPLLVVFVIAGLLLTSAGVLPQFSVMMDPGAALSPSQLLAVLLSVGAVFLGLSWVAVAWHRFILLEDYPGFLPPLHTKPLMSYMGRSVGLAFLMALILLPLATISGIVVAILGLTESVFAGLVVGYAMGLVFTFVWLRVALILPAVALGNPLTLREAWALSAPASNEIFNVSAIIVALNLAAGIVVDVLLGGGIFATIIDLGLTWVTMMVGTSLLTTLYGHLIEGRPLQ